VKLYLIAAKSENSLCFQGEIFLNEEKKEPKIGLLERTDVRNFFQMMRKTREDKKYHETNISSLIEDVLEGRNESDFFSL